VAKVWAWASVDRLCGTSGTSPSAGFRSRLRLRALRGSRRQDAVAGEHLTEGRVAARIDAVC
jgi:hypothetical protein